MLTAGWLKSMVAVVYVAIQAACCCVPSIPAASAKGCHGDPGPVARSCCSTSSEPGSAAASGETPTHAGCADCHNRHVLTPPISRDRVDLSPFAADPLAPVADFAISMPIPSRLAVRSTGPTGDPGPPPILPMDRRTTLLL